MTIFVNNVGSIVKKPWKGNLEAKGSEKQPFYYWNDLYAQKMLLGAQETLMEIGYAIDLNK